MMKSIVLVALVGTAVAGCSVRSERVVEVPASTTTQRTTTVSTDPYSPTTTTTTYTTPAR
ncbi:MAG: hypothetical protein ACK4JB_25190 [Reyranella sp.]